MCGLFGWVGKDPKQFNRDKFDKLGIYNVERGKHSCGVAIDGELYKGIGRTSEWSDFIINEKYPNPKKFPVVIGHTRQATSGARTIENAHPFKFEQEDGNFMIGAHNGSLTNEKGLAQKYNINYENKIDSQILIECLSKDHIEVLEDYKGAAALLIFDTEATDTLYIYRGASCKYKGTKTIEEERPLFFYIENDSSIYVSSIADSLKSIVSPEQDPDEVIYEVVPNKIYQIKAGKIKSRFIVDRSKVWDKDVSFKSARNTNTAVNNSGDQYKRITQSSMRQYNNSGTNSRVKNSEDANSKGHNPEKENNIYYEKVTHQEVNQMIYYENMRYKRTGHLVNGIFIFTEEFGFLKVSDNLNDLDKDLKSVSYMDKEINELVGLDDLSNAKLFYMHNGVLLKDEKDFLACQTHMNNTDYRNLSYMSMYPIINYKSNLKVLVKKSEQNILSENHLFTGEFSPIGAHATYECKNGILISKTVHDDINLPDSQDDYITVYDSISKFKETENEDNEEEDDDDTFEESMTKSLIENQNLHAIDAVIEAGLQITQTHELVSELANFDTDDILIKTILEYNYNSIKSFKPIADGIEELKELKETQEK